MENISVVKFGGTSLQDFDRIKAVAKFLYESKIERKIPVVVVVSAMGDTTNTLLKMAHQVSSSPSLREIDMLLTAGERISMSLLSIALGGLGAECVSLTGSQSGILTDGNFGNARIDQILGDRILTSLAAGKLVIVAGFQGVCPMTKEVTTLGRGGSDLSAVALAYFLKAQSCEIFTDVQGVYSCDPRLASYASNVRELSWDEMQVLADSGAGVLHYRAARVAYQHRIPLQIRSSFHFNGKKTYIGKTREAMEKANIKAMAVRKNQIFYQLFGNDDFSLFEPVLNLLSEMDVEFQSLSSSNSNYQFEFCIDEAAQGRVEELIEKLQIKNRKMIDRLWVLTLAGSQLKGDNYLLLSLLQSISKLTPILKQTCASHALKFLIRDPGQQGAEELLKNVHSFIEELV